MHDRDFKSGLSVVTSGVKIIRHS